MSMLRCGGKGLEHNGECKQEWQLHKATKLAAVVEEDGSFGTVGTRMNEVYFST